MSRLCGPNISDSFPTTITCVLLLAGITTLRGFLRSPFCVILHSVSPMFAIPNLFKSSCTPSNYSFLTANPRPIPNQRTPLYHRFYVRRVRPPRHMLTNHWILRPFTKDVIFGLPSSLDLVNFPSSPASSSPLSYKRTTCNSQYSVFEQYCFSPVPLVKFHTHIHKLKVYLVITVYRWTLIVLEKNFDLRYSTYAVRKSMINLRREPSINNMKFDRQNPRVE